MSKAFKCNRCKTCFDPDGIEIGEYFTTISEVYTQTTSDYAENIACGREYNVNFCPKCTKLFDRFLKGDEIIYVGKKEVDGTDNSDNIDDPVRDRSFMRKQLGLFRYFVEKGLESTLGNGNSSTIEWPEESEQKGSD